MKHFLLVIAFLLIISSPVYSQEGWRRLTTDDGLSSNVVLSILQDQNGDIWIGTEKRISRYNGVFEAFPSFSINLLGRVIFESARGQVVVRDKLSTDPHDKSISVSIINLFDGLKWGEPAFFRDNDITVSDMPEFSVVSGGKLWISTRDGLVGFDGKNWQLYNPDVDVNWLVKTPDGRLWSILWFGQAGDWTEGIGSFDGRKWNLEFNADNSLLDGTKTNTAFVTSTSQILLGTDQGLFQYNPGLNRLTSLTLGNVNVNSMLETVDGSIWVCATDQKEQKRFYRLHNSQWTSHLPDQDITILYQSPDNHLWAGGEHGLYLFDEEAWQPKLTDKVNCIYQLTDGTMLVGSDSGLWIKPSVDSSQKFELAVEQKGLHIKGIFQARNGMIWCRSDQGIISYDGQSWVRHNRELGNYAVVGLKAGAHEGLDGTMWFNGFTLDTYKDGVWEGHKPDGQNLRWSIGATTTSDGRVWVWGNGGASWWSVADNKWIRPIIINSWVYGFTESPNGRYWVGDAQGSTGYFDGDQWIEVRDKLRGQISFSEDEEGILWAFGGGIWKWQESENTWLEMMDDGVPRALFRAPKYSADGTWRLMSSGSPNIFARFDGGKLSIHPSSEQRDIHYRNMHGDGFAESPAGVFLVGHQSRVEAN